MRDPVLSRGTRHRTMAGAFVLLVLTCLNHWPVVTFGFVWDDYAYVVRQYPLQEPVSPASLWWCLTRFAEANWHPLTWLALHLQYQVFGLHPGGYHLVNVLLHAANVLLLDAALVRLTGARGKSFVVAALFAVHPLHVESVVWITEIKDVLSTLLLLLLIHCHIGQARRPGPWRLAASSALLALGLMAKGMLVTAPLLLLLLDWWPLGRLAGGPSCAREDRPCPRLSSTSLLVEKMPLVLLAAAAAVLTLLAQSQGGAMADLVRYPLGLRLANAANSAVVYLERLFWPWPLSFYYPYASISGARVLGCAATLVAITVAALALRRRLPAMAVGWLWYCLSLMPVVGIVQVGSQAMADRYTYIPSIGLLVATVWIGAAVLVRAGLATLLDKVLAGACIVALMVPALAYLGVWADETTLYSHALAVDADNPVAHNNLGNILLGRKRFGSALDHYAAAMRQAPASPLFPTNSGTACLLFGLPHLAMSRFDAALRLEAGFPVALTQKAVALIRLGRHAEARRLLQRALAAGHDADKAALLLAALELEGKNHHAAEELLLARLPDFYRHDPRRALALGLLRRCLVPAPRTTAHPDLPRRPLPGRVLADLRPDFRERRDPVTTVLVALGYLHQSAAL